MQTDSSYAGGKPMSSILLKEFGKASKLIAKGRLVPARDILERILARSPDHPATIINLAAVAFHMGELPKALDYALRAVKLEPTNSLFMLNVGEILFAQTLYDKAAEAYRIATQLDPRNAKAHSAFGIALRNLDRWDEATAASLRAIELDPTDAGAFENLAITLAAQRDFGKALQLFHEAIRLAPQSASAWNNLGSFLSARGGRTAEAATAFRNAIALDPGQSLARMNLGMALLKLGDFDNGWREYEHRVLVYSAFQRPASLPQWNGSAAPQTLLLHAEQGFGDTLQFCRYAPLVAARGHRVVLEVQPQLVELLTHSLASDSVDVVPFSALYPALAGLPPVDAHCPLLSLPLMFGMRLDSVPAAPYLRADPVRSRAWHERLGGLSGNLRVGIAWAGSPRQDWPIAMREIDARRSTTLAALAPLLAMSGVSFVSLQKDAPAQELRAGRFDRIYDADPELRSFADTAALVANLDLVICVDTSIAHLAGGMGKPVWMMSRFDGCFRWLEDRADTPWYPTMRIFRQGTDRSWEPVMASIAKELAQLVASKPDP